MSVRIFLSYAHEDEELLKKLKAHLSSLQSSGFINVWYDRAISAGTEWEGEICKHLNEAQIILLLISPDFMNSSYCYSKEMQRALERHGRGEARVIPIILRPVDWSNAPFNKLQLLPTDAKPIMSSNWYNTDEALFDVVKSIRKIVEELNNSQSTLEVPSDGTRLNGMEILDKQGNDKEEMTPTNVVSESYSIGCTGLTRCGEVFFTLSQKPHRIRVRIRYELFLFTYDVHLYVDEKEIWWGKFGEFRPYIPRPLHKFHIEGVICTCGFDMLFKFKVVVGMRKVLSFRHS